MSYWNSPEKPCGKPSKLHQKPGKTCKNGLRITRQKINPTTAAICTVRVNGAPKRWKKCSPPIKKMPKKWMAELFYEIILTRFSKLGQTRLSLEKIPAISAM